MGPSPRKLTIFLAVLNFLAAAASLVVFAATFIAAQPLFDV
jgi:hypothetical protein